MCFLVGHLVDAGGDRKDEDIVLPWLDLYTVGIAYAEPFLGNLSYLSGPVKASFERSIF